MGTVGHWPAKDSWHWYMYINIDDHFKKIWHGLCYCFMMYLYSEWRIYQQIGKSCDEFGIDHY
jgi:hypothetical protein